MVAPAATSRRSRVTPFARAQSITASTSAAPTPFRRISGATHIDIRHAVSVLVPSRAQRTMPTSRPLLTATNVGSFRSCLDQSPGGRAVASSSVLLNTSGASRRARSRMARNRGPSSVVSCSNRIIGLDRQRAHRCQNEREPSVHVDRPELSINAVVFTEREELQIGAFRREELERRLRRVTF